MSRRVEKKRKNGGLLVFGEKYSSYLFSRVTARLETGRVFERCGVPSRGSLRRNMNGPEYSEERSLGGKPGRSVG